jgi:hypothetical protein
VCDRRQLSHASGERLSKAFLCQTGSGSPLEIGFIALATSKRFHRRCGACELFKALASLSAGRQSTRLPPFFFATIATCLDRHNAAFSGARNAQGKAHPRGALRWFPDLAIAYFSASPSAGLCSAMAFSISSRRFWRASARLERFSSRSFSAPNSSMNAFSAPSPFWKPVRTMRR